MNETELPQFLPGQGQHLVVLRFTLRLNSIFQCLWFWVGPSGLNILHNSCIAASCGTAQQPSLRPWPAPQWPWPWAAFAAQPKGTWLLLSFPAPSPACLLCLLWQWIPSVPTSCKNLQVVPNHIIWFWIKIHISKHIWVQDFYYLAFHRHEVTVEKYIRKTGNFQSFKRDLEFMGTSISASTTNTDIPIFH